MTRARIPRREWLAGVSALAFTEAFLSRLPAAHADAAETPEHPPLARFTTTYETNAEHRPRAFNVELATEAIDERSIAPGETFSFNATVGERTAAYGFEKSVVLRRRMLAEGVGGGTCQVASTLHAAALLAGLDIVSRTPHSRPSAYIRMGLDATVAFPGIDLELRNPRADRVTLRARATHGRLDVWLEADGTSRPRVSLTSEIIERTPCGRTIEHDPHMPESEVHVRAHGIPGYRVLRVREIAGEERIRRDERTDIYPPTPEQLVVSPSFDLGRLDLYDAEDTPEGRLTPAIFRDEPGVQQPALVQLRPTTRIVLDNG
jgi:vancomycin resistance protein YoaR